MATVVNQHPVKNTVSCSLVVVAVAVAVLDRTELFHILSSQLKQVSLILFILCVCCLSYRSHYCCISVFIYFLFILVLVFEPLLFIGVFRIGLTTQLSLVNNSTTAERGTGLHQGIRAH